MMYSNLEIFRMVLVETLLITGLCYRLIPGLWRTSSWRYMPIAAIGVGVIQLISVLIVSVFLTDVLFACVLLGVGALLPDLFRALSGWVRNPKRISNLIRIAGIGLVIYLITCSPDLLEASIGPILLVVILSWGFKVLMRKSPFKIKKIK
jgi:hypothetical protein